MTTVCTCTDRILSSCSSTDQTYLNQIYEYGYDNERLRSSIKSYTCSQIYMFKSLLLSCFRVQFFWKLGAMDGISGVYIYMYHVLGGDPLLLNVFGKIVQHQEHIRRIIVSRPGYSGGCRETDVGMVSCSESDDEYFDVILALVSQQDPIRISEFQFTQTGAHKNVYTSYRQVCWQALKVRAYPSWPEKFLH